MLLLGRSRCIKNNVHFHVLFNVQYSTGYEIYEQICYLWFCLIFLCTLTAFTDSPTSKWFPWTHQHWVVVSSPQIKAFLSLDTVTKCWSPGHQSQDQIILLWILVFLSVFWISLNLYFSLLSSLRRWSAHVRSRDTESKYFPEFEKHICVTVRECASCRESVWSHVVVFQIRIFACSAFEACTWYITYKILQQ